MDYRFLIAFRNITGTKGEKLLFFTSLICIFLIALGVCALIVVLGIMKGFDYELKKRIVGISPHIRITHIDGIIKNYDEILQRIEEPEITRIFSYIEEKAIFKGKKVAAGMIIGLDKPEAIKIEMGEIPKDNNSILIGGELAWNISSSVGDTISLITAKELKSPKISELKISGIFTSGLYDIDSSVSYVTLQCAKNILGISGVSGIGIKIADLYKVEKVKERLYRKLPKELLIRTYKELNQTLFSALELERCVMTIILSIILLVALFSLFSLLTTTIIRKKREIGILRLLGTDRFSIALIFIIEGGIIGFLGTIIGLSLGLISGWAISSIIKLPADIYYISTIPFVIPLSSIFWICLFSFMFSIILSIYPGLFASKIALSDALRED